MKKTILILSSLLLVLIAGVLVASQTLMTKPSGTSNPSGTSGQKTSDLTFKLLDGSTMKLSDLKGKVVLLNFWATWCPYCRVELSHMQQGLLDKFKGKPFEFIAVNVGETKETAVRFRDQTGYTFKFGLDPNGTLFRSFNGNPLPLNVLIDKEGKVAGRYEGYAEHLMGTMAAEIEKLLKTK